jgi:hypothetical protein
MELIQKQIKIKEAENRGTADAEVLEYRTQMVSDRNKAEKEQPKSVRAYSSKEKAAMAQGSSLNPSVLSMMLEVNDVMIPWHMM